MRDVRIGTSGWAYKDWNGPFYPQEVKAAGRLAYISRRFRTLEINASFYRMPTDKAVAGWRDQTPGGHYHGRYREAALRDWAKAIRHWRKDRDVVVYFDNDIKSAAPKDAGQLIGLLSRT
jgi:uncharacterized protein YecE (DUF72 family)